MSRRQPSRRPAKPRRRAVSGPTPPQLAAAMVDAVAADLLDCDPLQAQLVASYVVADRLEQYWEALDAAVEQDDDPDDVPRPALGLIRLVGELREPSLREPALALALALASLDPQDDAVQDAAVEVVKRFRFLGAKLPAWAEEILQPELLGTWCVRDVFGDAMTLYIGTRHGVDAPSHYVAARIEQGRWAELVDVFVSEGPDVLVPEVERALAEDEDAALLRVEELSPARAGALLWDVIGDVEETGGEQLEDAAFDTFALLESRAMLLEPAVEAASEAERAASPFRSELDELGAEQLAERFVDSDAWRSTDGTHAELAQAMASWAAGSIADGVARFSPNLAMELLSDLAEAAEDDEQRALLIEHAVPTARAWARMCATATDLPDEALAEVERAIDEAEPRFEQLVREGPARRSPLTDQLMELMLEDGVDVGDQAQLDAWSERWNALSDEQRLERLHSLA